MEMFEHYRQPLLPRAEFYARLVRCFAIAAAILAFFILVGMAGFCILEKSSPLEAQLESVLIMVGVGTNYPVNSTGGKIFTSFYALFSSIAFYVILLIIFSPLVHRLLHRFHLDFEKKTSGSP